MHAQDIELFLSGRLLSAPPRVLSIRGKERANAIYSYELRVLLDARDDLTVDDGVLGMPVVVTLHRGSSPKTLHGVVLRVTAVGGAGYEGRTTYLIRVGPRLALMKRRVYSRIFCDQTSVEIALGLLSEHRIAHRLRLTRTYPKRAYSVQYQETDYAFFRRLLADCGVFFSFDHPSMSGPAAATNMGSSEVLVLGDSARAYSPVEGGDGFFARADSGALEAPDDVLFELSTGHAPRPTVALERAFDFMRPLADLRDTAQVATASAPHVAYAFEGSGDESPPEIVPAAVRLDQARIGASFATATSSCWRLSPGRTLTVEGHEVASANGAFVVTSVEHKCYATDAAPPRTPTYRNRLELTRSDTSIRPKRPRRQLRQVTETATVVGPPGKEIHVDAHGRIQVEFHWDLAAKRDGRHSAWLRVAQSWAGSGWGAQIIPRVGMEVVVTFIGGDIDRPLVTGAVYNATHPVPFPLPSEATKSGLRSRSSPESDGFHEISIDDTAGAERLFVRAERDFVRVVQHDDEEHVGNDQRLTVARDRLGDVGARDLLTVGVEHSVTVRAPSRTGTSMSDGRVGQTTGDAAFGLDGGDAKLKASGSAAIEAGGDVGITAGGVFKVEAGSIDMHAGSMDLKVDGNITITAGGTITIKGGDVVVVGGTIKEN